MTPDTLLQVSALQRKLEAAKAEASIDGLTGIANRRNFDFTIQRWVLSHEKSEDPFAVAIFDIDNFKRLNDTLGHQAGDAVLRAVYGLGIDNPSAPEFSHLVRWAASGRLWRLVASDLRPQPTVGDHPDRRKRVVGIRLPAEEDDVEARAGRGDHGSILLNSPIYSRGTA